MALCREFDFASARTSYTEFLGKHYKLGDKAADDFKKMVQVSPGSDNDKAQCVELSMREILKEIISKDLPINDAFLLFNLVISVTLKELCPTLTIFTMLSDLADCCTISQCEELFSYVELKISQWKMEPFFSKGRNHLLRMCNDILKRLSKSMNTVFCGRIQLFLARLFPLTEKSGLNLFSEFNLDNLTIFSSLPSSDPVEPVGSAGAEKMDTDKIEQELSARDAPIDYAFYSRFWSLQDYFRDPTQCYKKVDWKKFTTYTEVVLSAFQSAKLDDAKVIRQRQTLHNLQSKENQQFFAKYLTSEKLLNLQLSDSNFRRYVLVQMLVLFQYLTVKIKFRSNSFELTDDMNKWITKTTPLVYTLIQETPPDGEKFASIIKHILELEHTWSSWKNNSCPSFVRTVDPNEKRTHLIVRKRSMADDLNITESNYINLGNAELNRLWNMHADNEAIIRSERRQFLPQIETYFENAIMQSDPSNQIEETYKDVSKPDWQWRALRLLAKKSRHLFEQTQTPARKIPEYLEDIMRKLAKEIAPSSDQNNDVTTQEEVTLSAAQRDEEEEDIQSEDEEETPKEPEIKAVLMTDDSVPAAMDQTVEPISQPVPEVQIVSAEQLNVLAINLKEKWELLAKQLPEIEQDDMAYFREKETPLEQAKNMLTVWKEIANKDAVVDKLVSKLNDAGLGEIATKVFGK